MDEIKNEEQHRERERIAQSLPNGTPKELYESTTCLLCRNQPQTTTCYAITDMGHAPIRDEEKVIAGVIHAKKKVGEVIPLQIACCNECKKNNRVASMIRPLTILIVLAIALFVLSRTAVHEALYNIHPVVGLLIYLLCIPLSFWLGTVFQASYKKSASQKTIYDINELAYVQDMEKMGWFAINQNKKGEPSLIFSKERLTQNGLDD